jgi:hypothetical protein
MQYRALISAVALMSSTIMSGQAIAAVTLIDSVPAADPGAVIIDGMQATCDAAAAAADTDGAGGNVWTGEVNLGAVTLFAGPTETGSHSISDAIGDPVGAGTFTPAHRDILGNPFRNGGSVNMFGIQEAVGGHYSASTYDFDGTFTTTYAHAYTCDLYMALYHPAVHHDRVGHWIVAPDAQGNEEANTNNCNAFNTALPGGPSNGDPEFQANCQYIVDTAAGDDPAFNDDPVFDHNVAGGSINVDQEDTLLAHESAGEGFDTSETLLIGQVVVCISPKKLPGTWTKQNGYTGALCTTAWYNGGATLGVSNLNTGSHNYVTVPVL